jgi:hypothetical protein
MVLRTRQASAAVLSPRLYRHGLPAVEVADLLCGKVEFETATLPIHRAKNEPAVDPLSGREMRELRERQRESPQSPFAPLSAPGFSRVIERAAIAPPRNIQKTRHTALTPQRFKGIFRD